MIYFTNTANSGAGSLRQAILDAQPGDVVAPDPTVFGAGESVTISLSSRLDVRKALTLSGGSTRLTLLSTNLERCLYSFNDAAYFHAENLTIVGSVVAFAPENVFRNCYIGANNASAIGVLGRSAVSFYDCVVTGFRKQGCYNMR